ncbi:uncharacterized protein [Salminus brasiliensis]|uniref:uncharacterized protein isoform X2 n=1 Tax=Salminus brasiliensis TaxID=930266 RepID=UPI003B83944C
MTVKILFIFILYLMSVCGGASNKVAGYPGGGVLIKCKYEKSYTSHQKYFCKGSGLNCTDQIRTGVSNEWKNTGRFSLLDNTSAAEFWVLIRELTVEDSGTYQCAVDIGLKKNLTTVELKINKDLDQKKSISVNGLVGGSVNITCNYPQFFSSKPKFLCRRVGSVRCNYRTSVNESRRWIKEGKFSLYDDRAQQTFTVSINNMAKEDSGEYWCGAESDWESDHGYKVYITQINLRVTDPKRPTPPPNSSPSNRTQNTNATTSSSKGITNASFRLETPTEQPVKPLASAPTRSSPWSTEATSSSSTSTNKVTSSFKILTDPGVLPQSSTSISSLTPKPSTLSTSKTTLSSFSTAAATSTASSVFTAVAVILMLVLTGILFVIFTLRMRRNTQASTQDQSIGDSLNNARVSHTVYDYEEIKDITPLPAHLPTNPSDHFQAVYDDIQLATSPCDISNPVYSSTQLPLNPPHHGIYSTAPLPPRFSDSSVRDTNHSTGKPDEDPSYTTVNFKENDAVTTANVNKEEGSCDYATVKHVNGSV